MSKLIFNNSQFPSPFGKYPKVKAKHPLRLMKKDLFVTEFWELDVPDHEQIKKAVLHYVNSSTARSEYLDWKDTNPSTSTYGGFELEIDDVYQVLADTGEGYINHSTKPLKSLLDSVVQTSLKQILKEHQWEDGRWDVEYWLNVNKTGGYNPPHIHPNRHYSGTYYVHTPKKSGNINFLDPRAAHRFSAPEPASGFQENAYGIDNKYDASVFSYEPKEGKIVIFPSYLMHYVDPNPTDETRVSLAFNGNFRHYKNMVINPGIAPRDKFTYPEY